MLVFKKPICRLRSSATESKPVAKDVLSLNAGEWAATLTREYKRPVTMRLVKKTHHIFCVIEAVSVKKTVVPESVASFLKRWGQEEKVWGELGGDLPLEIPMDVSYIYKNPIETHFGNVWE